MKEEIKGIKNKDLDDFFDDDESDENIDLTNQKSEISQSPSSILITPDKLK